MVKFQILFAALMLIIFIGIPLQAQDTAPSTISEDTLSIEKGRDTLSMADLQLSDTTQARKKIKIIRREYKFKDQIGSAVGMMLFMTVILASVQSWNPK